MNENFKKGYLLQSLRYEIKELNKQLSLKDNVYYSFILGKFK